MRSKVLNIVQDINRAQEHEWVVKYIDRKSVDLHFALINGRGSVMETFLREWNVPVYHFDFSGKKQILRLMWDLLLLMRRQRFHVVHTHLFEASLAGLTAAKLAGIRKRVYTRHYSDYHHVWFPSTVKYDRYINFMATDIIATSNNVKQVLESLEQVAPGKIHLVHHGIDMSEYEPGAVSEERISRIRTSYRLTQAHPVIGAISRFTELKGVQYLIPAFKEIVAEFPNAVLVLANAKGDYYREITDLLTGINPDNYRLIPFENDIAALYKVFDCFVHIPINLTAEAFGQTYLEALASRVPSVFTLSGVAPEFIVSHEQAIVVPYRDAESVRNAILKVLRDPASVQEMTEKGYRAVQAKFDIRIKIEKLQQLYLSAL